MNFKTTIALVVLLFGVVKAYSQIPDSVSLNQGPWKVAPEPEVKSSGEQLSVTGYADDGWLTAHVPGTAYVDYVIAGKVPDPNMGDNVWISGGKKFDQNYWYRTEFSVPDAYFQSGRIWLNLDGVHRDADVYVNGAKVGEMKGFFQRGRFDVTSLVKKSEKNSLAVLAHIMVLATQKGPSGRLDQNCVSPALVCSRGWDWMPRVPGLNTGIYKDVYLTHTGDVSIIDPWIRTDVPNLNEANLLILTDLTNSSSSPIQGKLVGEINPGKIQFSRDVSLKPNDTETIALTPVDTPVLHVTNPKLWWPNGYGDPNLYSCKLEFRTSEALSDSKNVSFGIKKYTYEVKNDVLYFSINGKPIFLKGGSWGLPEYLMRNRTTADYDVRVRLHKEQNFNVIRNWMGSVPDEAFYQACDKYGIMVWDELWLNSHDGDPADIPVYHANVREKVKQFRNHPSICFWVAMNEGTPPPPVNDPIAEIIKKYDGNDRQYHPCSNSGNLSGSGPWVDFDPRVYFRGTFSFRGTEKPPRGNPFGMHSELGTAVVTSFDSLKKFMPKESLWPINNLWNLHYLGPKARNAFPDKYINDLGNRYGEGTSAEDFCLKAQLLNLETTKGMFEGWLDHSDQSASGLIIWMSHPAYPCFIWQTYDYYLDTTGAYWGAKTACEPVHIYWNSNDDRIRVVNTSGKSVSKLKADFWIYNLDGTEKGHQTAVVDAPWDKVSDCFKVITPADLSPTYFLKLKLSDEGGQIVSQNFYWRGTEFLDYGALNSMKQVQLKVSEPISEILPDHTVKMSLDISNPADSGAVAFAIRPKPIRPSTGEQVLPVFMNDGYFSLIPGETKRITFTYNPADAGGEIPKVVVECWNNAPHCTPTKPGPLPIKPPNIKVPKTDKALNKE